MRCIDADRLLTDRMKSKYYHLPNGDIAIPLIDIEHAPTIEPEQKTGKWIERDSNGVWQCDQCRKYCLIYKAHYCPSCGARMGEQDD